MIAGMIQLADLTLVFGPGSAEGMVRCSVCEGLTGLTETAEHDQAAFLAALSIAVHNGGEPNAERDYRVAEMVQPKSKKLRWVP